MDVYKNIHTHFAPKERYEQQLDDIRWKFKADNIRIRDKHKCRVCGAKDVQLDVHHIRYLNGREAWDYDDGDLVTLCHKCHENLHNSVNFSQLVKGGYFYHKYHKGVGIIASMWSEGLDFDVCWTETDREVEEHGRLYYKDSATKDEVRPATLSEINDFWDKIERYYSINEIIIFLGNNLKNLLPKDSDIRIKARNCYKEALDTCEKRMRYIKETFNFLLLVSNDYFAVVKNNIGLYPRNLPTNELPLVYFEIVPIKNVNEKIRQKNINRIEFDVFDFSNYRAATIEELREWLEYEDSIDDLKDEMSEHELPF